MASIQMHDIRPAETPMEDLSDNVTSSIYGGSALGDFLQTGL